jgi:hypothetical protein
VLFFLKKTGSRTHSDPKFGRRVSCSFRRRYTGSSYVITGKEPVFEGGVLGTSASCTFHAITGKRDNEKFLALIALCSQNISEAQERHTFACGIRNITTAR